MQLYLEYWRTPAVKGPEERDDGASVAAGRQPPAPNCVSNGTGRRSAVKTVSQGKRGHCNQTRASTSRGQHIKYEWCVEQPANVFVHK